MSDKEEVIVELAGREWKRQFYGAVVRSLAKTITEPVTNSDTSYKRKLNLPHAAGLIGQALSLKKGTKFDLTEIKDQFRNPKLRRYIEIHIYTAKGHGREKRTCEIVDHAEGLSYDSLKKAFKDFAADKSDVSKGQPGRSLFGRGVSDVLFGHLNGVFYSYHDGVLSTAEFTFDKKPKFIIHRNDKPTATILKDLHLKPGINGTCVRFILHEDCHIYEEGTIIPRLSQFYMLRLINSDPNIELNIYRYASGGKKTDARLLYDFPIGDVIEKFEFLIQDPINGAALKPLEVQAIVCRADVKDLPGGKDKEQKANGFLIVDDKDAVLDITLLTDFEDAPYLKSIYGIIRISNIRAVCEWFLNQGKSSPLTTDREGFDLKNEFTKRLFDELYKHLKPIYEHEKERYEKSFVTDIPKEAKQKVDDLLKELNKYLKELEGIGAGGGPEEPKNEIDTKKLIQFLPDKVKLRAGNARTVKLYVRKEVVKKDGSIIIDSNNTCVEIAPLSYSIQDGKADNEYLVYSISIRCDKIHEQAEITALCDGRDQTLEAKLEIIDVVSGPNIIPPECMEFRPWEASGQPNRTNSIALYINEYCIPVGRKINVDIDKSHGTLGLIDNHKIVKSLSIVFEKKHIVSGTNVGKILIPWRGTGWGQSARIEATTKRPNNGEIVSATGRIILEQVEDTGGGILKDVKYRPLDSGVCAKFSSYDATIFINSNHNLNKMVFGTSEQEFWDKFENDYTAQYRFNLLVVEEAVYHLSETKYVNSQLTINPKSPFSDVRTIIDKETHYLAPKIIKTMLGKFKPKANI